MLKKLVATAVLAALVGAVAMVGFAAAPSTAIQPIAADSPCPAAGCASGACHGFLGLGAFIMVAAHVVESGEGLGGRGRVGQLVLNAVLLLALAVCVVSGVMVSGTVLPSLGLYASGYHFWDPLHAVAAKVLLAALLVHLVVRAPAALAVLRQRRGLRAAESDCLMGR